MLRIGLCDDEAPARDSLRFALQKQLRDESDYFEFSSGEGALRWLEKHAGELDLLFLDVEMPGMNGLETARQLRAEGHKLALVFVTGYADFVFDGYAVGAMDYLIKPAQADKLSALLERFQASRGEQLSFAVRNAEGLYRVPLDDILYCYSDKRLVFVVTAQREYSFYGKLDETAAELGRGFVRIHQRYLVSARAVTALEGDSAALGDLRLPISRALKNEATLALARALME